MTKNIEGLMALIEDYAEARAETALHNAGAWPNGKPVRIARPRREAVRAYATALLEAATSPPVQPAAPAMDEWLKEAERLADELASAALNYGRRDGIGWDDKTSMARMALLAHLSKRTEGCAGQCGAAIPEGWRFYSADFSLNAADPMKQGNILLIRDPDGVRQWHAATEADKEVISLYMSGCGYSFEEALTNAAHSAAPGAARPPEHALLDVLRDLADVGIVMMSAWVWQDEPMSYRITARGRDGWRKTGDARTFEEAIRAIDAAQWASPVTSKPEQEQPEAHLAAPEASAAPEKMHITYERNGRCFWHTNCVNHFGGIMFLVRNEEKRSLVKCGHCGQQGFYPVGSVGCVVAERQADAAQADAAPVLSALQRDQLTQDLATAITVLDRSNFKDVAKRLAVLSGSLWDAPVASRDAPSTDALRDVAAERQRQIEREGWTPEHDDQHDDGELSLAAACYSAHTGVDVALDHLPQPDRVSYRLQQAQDFVRQMWPWDRKWWKPKDRRSNLVRAGALILAEIERLDRAALTRAKEVQP
jgi:hypothetical protein